MPQHLPVGRSTTICTEASKTPLATTSQDDIVVISIEFLATCKVTSASIHIGARSKEIRSISGDVVGVRTNSEIALIQVSQKDS
jgi:hypothetical protein